MSDEWRKRLERIPCGPTAGAACVNENSHDTEAEMEAFDGVDKHKQREAYRKEALHLLEKMHAKADSGQDINCSRRIYEEVHWLLKYNSDFDKLKKRLKDLKKSVDSRPEPSIENQSPIDGSWGACFNEWYWKMTETNDYMVSLWYDNDQKVNPKYPARFLDRINSPDKLIRYLSGLLVSDVRNTGTDHRKEFNEAMQIIKYVLPDIPKNYKFDRDLKGALIGFLSRSQDKDTGYWGEWYKKEGRIVKTNDLSITYHILAYCGHSEEAMKGLQLDWDRIARTTLEMKEKDYPYGWKEGGECFNHHNMDVTRIFKLAWKHIKDKTLKERIQREIEEMIDWCLNDSLEKVTIENGMEVHIFKQKGYEKYEETRCGIAFLRNVGYFDRKKKPFWWPDGKQYDGFSGSEKVWQGLYDAVTFLSESQKSQDMRDAIKLLEACKPSRS